MGIHSTAIISKNAQISDSADIGPFCVIKGKVKIGPRTKLDSHVCVGTDNTEIIIGSDNHFCQGAVIGGPPQDLTYKDEPTSLVIGDFNTIREFCTINIGTVKGGGVTRIANHCLLMAYTHVAHDCQIGNHVVIANSAQFAGHVKVEDHVKIGGGCLFSQFITLGEYCYIAGDTAVNKDVVPYCIAYGNFATMRATNKIGLQRAGFEKSVIDNIHKAIKFLIKGGLTVDEAVEKMKTDCESSEPILKLINFVSKSERGLAR